MRILKKIYILMLVFFIPLQLLVIYDDFFDDSIFTFYKKNILVLFSIIIFSLIVALISLHLNESKGRIKRIIFVSIPLFFETFIAIGSIYLLVFFLTDLALLRGAIKESFKEGYRQFFYTSGGMLLLVCLPIICGHSVIHRIKTLKRLYNSGDVTLNSD